MHSINKCPIQFVTASATLCNLNFKQTWKSLTETCKQGMVREELEAGFHTKINVSIIIYKKKKKKKDKT